MVTGKSLRPVLLIAMMAILTSVCMADQGMIQHLQGHWKGTIKVPSKSLEVNLDFQTENGVLKGDISIPAQGAQDLPLQNIRVTGDSVHFMIADIPGNPAFHGRIQSGKRTIEGTFRQGGQNFPFTLGKSASAAAEANEALRDLDSFTSQAMEDWKVPGLAVAVVVEDQVIYSRGFGHRDVENKRPVTPHTLFAIGSATKAFTTFAMASLVQEGSLEWETPVQDYLPEFRMHDPVVTDHITPRDLVTHRSGLPRHDLMWYNNQEISREKLVHRLRYLPLNAGLRQEYQYNNLMYLTAGYLVEELTGQTWEQAVRSRILNPLNMNRTNFSIESSRKDTNYALPYQEKDDLIERMEFRNIDVMAPAGAINSSVMEMTHWLKLHLNRGKYEGAELLNTTLLEGLHTPYTPIPGSSEREEISSASYGPGWFIQTYRGHKRVSHGGNIDGFTALVTLFPDDRAGIVVLANKNAAGFPDVLTKHIADRILGLDPVAWNDEGLQSRKQSEQAQEKAEEKQGATRRKGTRPTHTLDAFTGNYRHPGYGLLKVRQADDSLQFTFNDITTTLEHWHYNVFNGLEGEDATFEDMKLQFHTNMDGYIASLEAPFEPAVDNMVFVKQPDPKLSDPGYLREMTGRYVLADDTISVTLTGSRLRLKFPGQPLYTLIPALGDRFQFQDYQVIHVEFSRDESNTVETLLLDQPNGRFTAEKIAGD